MGLDNTTNSHVFFHPANPHFKWIFLFFCCFMTFGSYWCYDIPSALHESLENRLNIGDVQFALFYSVYNFMNIGIVLLGGYFIDRIGLRIGSVLFCFFIALGQVIMAIGISLTNENAAFAVMIIGRVIFSIGGESLSVAQSTYCSKWFKGKQLALSFGITLSFARIGSFANFVVTPKIAANTSIPFAFWFGAIACLVSLAMTLMASIADKVRDQHVKTEAVSAATPFHIRDVLYFPASLWLIYFICVFYYIGVFVLISVSGTKYMQAMFGFSEQNTGTIVALPYLMSVALAPIMGFAVGKIGWKPLMLAIASVIMAIAYSVLLWGPHEVVWSPYPFTMYLPPFVAMLLMGVSYSLCAAALWPCVPLLVDDSKVGTAYGIMNAIQNGGLALASVVVGLLSCKALTAHCTTPPLYLLMGVGGLTFLCCILLLMYDLTHGRKLINPKGPTPAEGPSESDPLLNGEK